MILLTVSGTWTPGWRLFSCPRLRIGEPWSPVALAKTCHCVRSTRTESPRVSPALVLRTGPRGCIHVSSRPKDKSGASHHRAPPRLSLDCVRSPRLWLWSTRWFPRATTTIPPHYHHRHRYRPSPSIVLVLTSNSHQLVFVP